VTEDDVHKIMTIDPNMGCLQRLGYWTFLTHIANNLDQQGVSMLIKELIAQEPPQLGLGE
jgi:hypothetical protein